MGYQVAAMTLGGLAALFPAGLIIDRFGTRVALLGGVVTTTVGLTMAALVRDRAAIQAAAVIIGIGGAACRVSWGPAIMRLTTPENRTRAFTWNVAILIGSSAVWTVLAGAIPDWTARVSTMSGLSGTQLVLLGGAAISGLALVCYWPLDLPPATQATASRAVALPREVRAIVPVVAFWMLAPAIVNPFFNVFFVDRFAMPVRWVGVLFASAHVGTVVVLIVAAEAARRWGPQRALTWWTVALAPSLALLAAAKTLAVGIGLYFIQGLVGPATNPLIDQLVLERVDEARHGVVAAWRNAAAEASGALGATLGGHLLDATSFAALLLVAGAVATMSGLLMTGVLRAGHAARRSTEAGLG